MKPKIKDYKIVLQAEHFVTTSKKSKRKLIDFSIEEKFIEELGENYKDWYKIDFLIKPKIVTESIKATTTLERLEIGL
jgi:hypothetical protein